MNRRILTASADRVDRHDPAPGATVSSRVADPVRHRRLGPGGRRRHGQERPDRVAQASGMTLVVFAGSAQLASLPLIAAGADLGDLRHRAGRQPALRDLFRLAGPAFRAPAVVPALLSRVYLGRRVDRAVPAALSRRRRPPGKLSFLKGLMFRTGRPGRSVRWPASSSAAPCPTEWQLGFAGTLAILCIMVPLMAQQRRLVRRAGGRRGRRAGARLAVQAGPAGWRCWPAW
jgi:hypothetical protein